MNQWEWDMNRYGWGLDGDGQHGGNWAIYRGHKLMIIGGSGLIE